MSARVRLYAHRGAAIEQPENTMASFRRAVELGATALETDVHLTSDGHVVVSHDPDGERMCGVRAAISACSLRDVQGWDAGWGFRDPQGARPFARQQLRVPTLDELLGEFPGMPINVDLKVDSPAMAHKFLELVRRRRDEERVIAASFHRSVLKLLRRHFYAGLTALAQTEVMELLALPVFLWRRLPARGQAAQLPVRFGPLPLASRPVIARCHAAGVRIDFWTINDAAEARALLALGVDGIMTDDPGTIAPVLRDAGVL